MSSIRVAMITMGYKRANQRPACKACTHAKEQPVTEGFCSRWSCQKGGFSTSAMAVCNQFVSRPVTGVMEQCT